MATFHTIYTSYQNIIVGELVQRYKLSRNVFTAKIKTNPTATSNSTCPDHLLCASARERAQTVSYAIPAKNVYFPVSLLQIHLVSITQSCTENNNDTYLLSMMLLVLCNDLQ